MLEPSSQFSVDNRIGRSKRFAQPIWRTVLFKFSGARLTLSIHPCYADDECGSSFSPRLIYIVYRVIPNIQTDRPSQPPAKSSSDHLTCLDFTFSWPSYPNFRSLRSQHLAAHSHPSAVYPRSFEVRSGASLRAVNVD